MFCACLGLAFFTKAPRGFACDFLESFLVVEAIKRPIRVELSFTLGGCGRQGRLADRIFVQRVLDSCSSNGRKRVRSLLHLELSAWNIELQPAAGRTSMTAHALIPTAGGEDFAEPVAAQLRIGL